MWDERGEAYSTYGQKASHTCLQSFGRKPVKIIKIDVKELEFEVVDWVVWLRMDTSKGLL
jgi:hypothetical protein